MTLDHFLRRAVQAAIAALIIIGLGLLALAADLIQLPGRLSASEVSSALRARAEAITSGDAPFDDTVRQTGAQVDGVTLRVTGQALIDPQSVEGSFLGARQRRAVAMLCDDPTTFQLLESGAVFTWRWSDMSGDDIGGNTLGGTAACEARQQ